MAPDGAEYLEEHPWRYGYSRAQLCLVCFLIVAVGMGYVAAAGSLDWPGSLFTLAVCGGCVAFTVWDSRRHSARMRRVIRATGLISRLAATLPRRTDEETLAVVGEIRARYAEALGLADKIRPGGRRFAGQMRSRLDRIDRAYDAEAGRLRYPDAGVGYLARDVRRFSRGVGAMRIR